MMRPDSHVSYCQSLSLIHAAQSNEKYTLLCIRVYTCTLLHLCTLDGASYKTCSLLLLGPCHEHAKG